MTVSSPANALDLDADTRFYTMTFVNSLGQESAPGPVTENPIYVGPDTTVNIEVPRQGAVVYSPAAYGNHPVKDYVPIVAARFYRTNTGTSETGYQFISQQTLYTAKYNFADIENSELGESLVTDSWDIPPPKVTAGCKMANGTYILVHEYRVYMSVPGVVYAYPILYTQTVKDIMLHVESVGTSAVALSSGGPYLIAGGGPDVMEVVKLPFNQVVTSTRGVSVYLDLVVYPAQDGLMGVSSAGKVMNLTESLYEELQWRDAYDLDTLVSVVHDGIYYAWGADSRGFAYSFKTKQLQPLDSNALFGVNEPTAMYFDTSTDSLYMAVNPLTNNSARRGLFEWQPAGDDVDGASTNRVAKVWEWESKEFLVPDRGYGAMKLMGNLSAANRVEVTLSVDGVDLPAFLTHPDEATPGVCRSEDPFRLPSFRGSRLIVKLKSYSGNPYIDTMQLSVHPTELL